MKNSKKIRCITCGHAMEPAVGPMLFLKKYIVEGVAHHKCRHCGQETVSGAEYERIRKKLAAAKKTGKSAVGRALSIGRYFVL